MIRKFSVFWLSVAHVCAVPASGNEAKARRAVPELAECWCSLLRCPWRFCMCVLLPSVSGLSAGDVRKVAYALDAIAAADPFEDPEPLDELVLEVFLFFLPHPHPFLFLLLLSMACTGIPLAEGAHSR